MLKWFISFAAAGCALASPFPGPQAMPSTKDIVAFAGVNIAGFDFGCGIDGTCDTQSTFDVATTGSGIQQMLHFVKDDGLNAFRLPVAWQFLVNNQLGGLLDPRNTAAYNKLVQGCVSSGVKLCIIDM
jgi:endoglucanase